MILRADGPVLLTKNIKYEAKTYKRSETGAKAADEDDSYKHQGIVSLQYFWVERFKDVLVHENQGRTTFGSCVLSGCDLPFMFG